MPTIDPDTGGVEGGVYGPTAPSTGNNTPSETFALEMTTPGLDPHLWTLYEAWKKRQEEAAGSTSEGTDVLDLGGGGDGGSGGSGGPSALQQRIAEETAFASFREVLRRWGIPASKNMLNLIQKAVKQGWGSTLFIDHLRHTPDYHEKFPGIRYGVGMTEASYNAMYKQYRDQAKSIGEQLSRKTFARAIKNGVTPEEFAARTKAVDSILKWSPMMEGFKETLAANGFTDKAENITQRDLMKFAMGLGPKKWEALWQETVVSTNLERVAGMTVGSPPKGWGKNAPNKFGGGSGIESVDHDWMHISRNDLLTVINQVESLSPGFEVEDISGQEWRDMGVRMRKYKGNFLAKYGVNAKDMLEMELGGPRAAAIATKGEAILAEQEAYAQPRATPMEAQQVGAPGAGYKDLAQSQ